MTISQCHSSSHLHDGSYAKQAPAPQQIAEKRPEAQISEEDKKQIRSYRPPEFRSPEFTASEISRHAATASNDAYQWLLLHRVDSLSRPEAYNKVVNLDFPELAARVYVDADPQGLDWACKFLLWLFVLDDLMDDTVTGMSPGSLLPIFLELNLLLLWSFPEERALHEKLMMFVDSYPNSDLKKASLELLDIELSKAKNFPNTVYDGKLSPLGSCLRDLWATVVETGPEILSLRIAHYLQHYFVGNLLESRNREGNVIPSIEDYILIRRRTGAMDICVVIVDLVYKVHLSNNLFGSLQMQRLLNAVNDIVCWNNDMWSYRKEALRGDPHNMVFLVSHEQKCSHTEAAFHTRDMIESSIADMRNAAADLQAITEPADQLAVSQYIKTCFYWLSGTEFWHRERATSRFDIGMA